jgi:hypothetical protein
MIPKNEVSKIIFEYLSKDATNDGFKIDLKNYWLIKKDPEAIFLYSIHFYDRTNIKTREKGFLVESYVWINVKAIENIYKEVTVNQELKRETDFLTLGNSIADLNANPGGIYKKRNESLDLFVFEEKNAYYVAHELLSHFNRQALPYFHNNYTVDAVDRLVNSHVKEYCVHMRNDTYRIIKGLIAARLNNNVRFTELHEMYSQRIIERDMPDNTKEELSNLMAYFK